MENQDMKKVTNDLYLIIKTKYKKSPNWRMTDEDWVSFLFIKCRDSLHKWDPNRGALSTWVAYRARTIRSNFLKRSETKIEWFQYEDENVYSSINMEDLYIAALDA